MAVISGGIRSGGIRGWRRRTLAMIIAFGVAATFLINSAPAQAVQRPAVIGKRVIGHSVQGRSITAWHLGNAHARTTVVLIAQMHGNEQRVASILYSLRDGKPITGINLWVVPSYNPDGHAHDTRQNAHGVDLNRNYPTGWRRTTGAYNSGKKAASEPETRAMMKFLKRVKPDYVISFHQPLHGVDLLTKRKSFSHKLAKALKLPNKRFSCDGGCHGTLTMWFNHNFHGEAITVEYGSRPTRDRMRHKAVTQLLGVFGAKR